MTHPRATTCYLLHKIGSRAQLAGDSSKAIHADRMLKWQNSVPLSGKAMEDYEELMEGEG